MMDLDEFVMRMTINAYSPQRTKDEHTQMVKSLCDVWYATKKAIAEHNYESA